MVALNTNLYYTRNKQVEDETDPAGQLAWLTNTLQAADRDGEKVRKGPDQRVGAWEVGEGC